VPIAHATEYKFSRKLTFPLSLRQAHDEDRRHTLCQPRHRGKLTRSVHSATHRIVSCFTMSPPLPVTPPSLEVADTDPGFFSKSFQNLRLSSAARGPVSIAYPDYVEEKAYRLWPASDHPGSSSCEAHEFHGPGSQCCAPMSDSSRYSASCPESHSS
jgi:hypothetical protein